METAVVRRTLDPFLLDDPDRAYHVRADVQRGLYLEMDRFIANKLRDREAHVVQYFPLRRDMGPGPWGMHEVWELRAIVMPVFVQRGQRELRAFQAEDRWAEYWRQSEPKPTIGDAVKTLDAQLDTLAQGREHVFVTVDGRVRAYRRKRLGWKRIW